jgi:hypothetical protein
MAHARQHEFSDMFGEDEEDYGQARQQPRAVVAAAAAAPPRDWGREMRRDLQLVRHNDHSSDDDSEDMNMLGGRDGVVVGGAEEKAEHIADQWEFHDFDQEDWSDIREEYTDDPDYCYLCACTQSDKELEGNPNLKLYMTFLVESYSKMTRKVLAIQGQKIYNDILRPHTSSKKPMRCQTIIDHLEKHAPTVRIQLEHMNRTLNSCLMEQAKQLRQREKGTAKTRLSTPNVNTYVKLAAFQNDVTSRLSKIRPDAKK